MTKPFLSSIVSFLAALLLVVLLSYGCISDSQNAHRNAAATDSLQNAIENLQNEADSLRRVLDHRETNGTDWFHPDYEGRMLKSNGIDQPEKFIEEALQSSTDLIPLKSVQGGTMHFSQIEILSRKWIIASYEDGHIMGKSLIQYTVRDDQTIQFTIMDSVKL